MRLRPEGGSGPSRAWAEAEIALNARGDLELAQIACSGRARLHALPLERFSITLECVDALSRGTLLVERLSGLLPNGLRGVVAQALGVAFLSARARS